MIVRFSVTIKIHLPGQQKIDSSFTGAVLISVLSGERVGNLEASLPPCQVRVSRILAKVRASLSSIHSSLTLVQLLSASYVVLNF